MPNHIKCYECSNPAYPGRYNEIRKPVCDKCHAAILQFLNDLQKERRNA